MWFFSVPFFCLIIFYCVLDSVQMIAEFQRMPFVRVFLSWVEQIGWGAEAVEAQAGPAAPLQSQRHCWLVPLILGWFFWPFNWEFKKTVENLFLPQQMLCLGLYTLPFRAPDSKNALKVMGSVFEVNTLSSAESCLRHTDCGRLHAGVRLIWPSCPAFLKQSLEFSKCSLGKLRLLFGTPYPKPVYRYVPPK